MCELNLKKNGGKKHESEIVYLSQKKTQIRRAKKSNSRVARGTAYVMHYKHPVLSYFDTINSINIITYICFVLRDPTW